MNNFFRADSFVDSVEFPKFGSGSVILVADSISPRILLRHSSALIPVEQWMVLTGVSESGRKSKSPRRSSKSAGLSAGGK